MFDFLYDPCITTKKTYKSYMTQYDYWESNMALCDC